MQNINKEGDQVDIQTPMPEGTRKRKRMRTIVVTIVIILCLLAGAALGVTLFVVNALTPVEASEEQVQIIIEPGMHSSKIVQLLEIKGLIRNETVFKYYLRYHNEGDRFQAGTYEMQPGISLDEIIMKLNNGDTVKEDMMRFTIPEGLTVLQIADKLSEEQLIDRDRFLQLIEQPENLKAESLQHIPDNPAIMHRLEGYLFPETYELKKDSTEEDIINRMLMELDNKLANLPEGWEAQLEQLGLSFHEMMTISSLIEREVVVNEERPLVAGVIYNRLGIPMRLQIDATVQYALEKPKERLLFADLKVDSPYNTYENDGIPPGPIASPSLLSIEAALYPEETTYLYYVTKKDGTQGHLFSETYEEHLQNIELSKQ